MARFSVFILGPTATGKSSVALALARELGGVVCNLDAFQVYRGLDIGTGKPTLAEQGGLPHELFDLAGPCDPFSVADYLRHASGVLDKYRNTAKPLVWVGGTGLYYRALRCGLSEAPASDPEVLQALEARPLAELQEEIRRVDPEWAGGADLANPRRVLRALAVFRQTGRPISAWHRDPVRPLVPEGTAWLLQAVPGWLRGRIAARVSTMWEAGWSGEVRRLLQLPGWEASPSQRALGYAEVAAWCGGGGVGEEGAALVRERIVTRTWQYARRQLTWFRREPNLNCIEIDERSDSYLIARSLRRTLPVSRP